MSDKKTAESEAPGKPAPVEAHKHPEGHKPAQPIDQAHHGRVRKPHGATNQPKE